MTAEEQTGVTQAAAEQVHQSQESPPEQSAPASQGPSAEDQDKNWREIRSVVKGLSDENRVLKEQIAHINSPPRQEEPDDWDSLSGEDIITKKQLMSYGTKIHEKAKKEAFSEFYNKTAEDRLESKYNDYRSVVSPENIEKLKNRYPDLAKSIASNTDSFSQGKAAYDLIMSTGIHNQEVVVNKEKMNQNMQKPQLAAGGKAGPLDSAHLFESGQRPTLTKSLKSQLQKEMNEAMMQS